MATIAPVAAVTVSGHAGRGRTTVADRVIDRIAEQAAIEDVDVFSAKANARVTGQTTVVEIGLGLRYPTPIGATTERVRSHLMARVQELSGLSVSRVDVAVAELVTDIKPDRRVQ
jgi:uncharacterized alkaline shock family protein YloU